MRINQHAGKCPSAPREHHGAFTLIELLIVIAIMAILASLLIPALTGAKEKSKGIFCLNNIRQLGMALHMYAGDFEDFLPYNMGSQGIQETVASEEYLNWANDVMTWALDSDNTNSWLLASRGIGPYAGGSAKVFKCPSDTILSTVQSGVGWRERVRSVSMNAMLGNAGEFMTGSRNTNNPTYRQFMRLAEVPEPSRIFAFVEEHPDSINDGYFINRYNQQQWIDLPASYHNSGANFAFVDGHAEYHRWKNKLTRQPSRPDGAQLPLMVPPGERDDLYWVLSRTSIPETPTPYPYQH